MKVTIVRPTQKCGTILCQWGHGRWYFVSLIVGGEVISEREYCLGYNGYCSEYLVAEDILNAVGLNSKEYSLLHPLHYDLWALIRKCEDFSVELWEEGLSTAQ